MRDLVLDHPRHSIPAMSTSAIDTVRRLEAASLAEMPQVALPVEHTLHAGMYARTVKLPAGALITGVHITIATVLILQGNALIYVDGDKPLHVAGYKVIPADAGRKQAFVAIEETHLTMIFPTAAKNVEQAEAEFTDEAHMLQTRRAECQA